MIQGFHINSLHSLCPPCQKKTISKKRTLFLLIPIHEENKGKCIRVYEITLKKI